MKLQNKVALVTGAGVRLGQAIAQKLGQMGMHVVIHYHLSEKGAKQTAELLKKYKSRHYIVQANLKGVGDYLWIHLLQLNFFELLHLVYKTYVQTLTNIRHRIK